MRLVARVIVVLSVLLASTGVAGPSWADHTDPRQPLAPTEGSPPAEIITTGAGTWEFIDNFPANPGTDLKFLAKAGDVFAFSGTLGQADVDHVGQRMIQLVDGRVVAPQWLADHGSAHCTTENPSGTTGLQHDAALAGQTILVDTTDATGRCHDGAGGGLELVDISAIGRPTFEPREIHLTRHAGTSHTVTVDATRPWIVYNSSSDFSGRPWIDVLDIRSCFLSKATLQQRRDACRPLVYRIPFEPQWSQQRNWYDGQLRPGSEAACHDITARVGIIYCAALNATLIFDVSGLTDGDGNIKGTPLECPVVDGENTAAKVTNCSGVGPGAPSAEGWVFLGTFNHPGRDCLPPPGNNQTCNSNLFVESDEGVAVSHESDPTPDGQHLFVTDERGGGVVPPGSSCAPGVENPYGNGGIHVLDISDPSNIQYALKPDGSKAVFIGEAVVPAETFCDVHVIEQVPGEQRIVAAYYSQGTKIIDYQVDQDGRWTFTEVASLVLPGANTWVAQQFKIVKNKDGTRTYFIMTSDIQRGIDVVKWTGPAGPKLGAVAPSGGWSRVDLANIGLAGLGLIGLPLATWLGRRRRR
jgi:hypothetical protein